MRSSTSLASRVAFTSPTRATQLWTSASSGAVMPWCLGQARWGGGQPGSRSFLLAMLSLRATSSIPICHTTTSFSRASTCQSTTRRSGCFFQTTGTAPYGRTGPNRRRALVPGPALWCCMAGREKLRATSRSGSRWARASVICSLEGVTCSPRSGRRS